jgi:hypothetical protein
MKECVMAKEIREEKARQGNWGYPVLIVLVCALLLAAVAWWGAELFGEQIETEGTATQPGQMTTQPQPQQ